MSRKLRMIRSTGLLTFAEIVSRLFPLIILRQAQSALGIEAFGSAQLLLNSIDLAIQFIGIGYGSYAALEIANHRDAPQQIGRIASTVILIRALHGVAIFTALVSSVLLGFVHDNGAVFGLMLLALAAVFDMEFLHSSLQRMSGLSVMMLIAKIVGMVSILAFVSSPQDSMLYASLVIGTNSLLSLGTYFYHFGSVAWVRPSRMDLRQCFLRALPFNISLLILGVVDRMDLLLVKKYFDERAAGIYAIPLKISQSIGPLLVSVSRVFYSEMLAKEADRSFITRMVRVECLLTWGVLLPMAVGALWTGEPLLSAVFAIEHEDYNALVAMTLLSAAMSLLLYIFGYQILWRERKILSVTIATALVIVVAYTAVEPLRESLGLLAVPVAMTIGKSVAVTMVLLQSKNYLNHLPIKEFFVIALGCAAMAGTLCFVPHWTIAIGVGALVYGLVQLVYLKFDTKHSFRS